MYGFEEFLETMLLVLMGFLIVLLVLTLVEYVLKGIALSQMARNVGLPNPALAWVPVANNYLLGTLCDRSQYALTGKEWKFSIILPVLDLLSLLGGGVLTGLYGLFNDYLYYGSEYSFYDTNFRSGIGNLLGLAAAAATATALYHLFKDYAPGREVLYTVLALILGSLAQVILLMTLRNKVPLSANPQYWNLWTQPPPYQDPAGGQPPYQGGPGTTGWNQPPYQGGPGTTGWNQPPYQGGPGTTGWNQPPYQGGPGTTGWNQPPYQSGPGTTGWNQPPYQGGPGTTGLGQQSDPPSPEQPPPAEPSSPEDRGPEL